MKDMKDFGSIYEALQTLDSFALLIGGTWLPGHPSLYALLVSDGAAGKDHRAKTAKTAIISKPQFHEVLRILSRYGREWTPYPFASDEPSVFVEISGTDLMASCSLGLDASTLQALTEITALLSSAQRDTVLPLMEALEGVLRSSSGRAN